MCVAHLVCAPALAVCVWILKCVAQTATVLCECRWALALGSHMPTIRETAHVTIILVAPRDMDINGNQWESMEINGNQ